MTTAYRIAVTLISPETCLLENTVQRARSQIVAAFSRDRHPPGLSQVLELTVTPARRDQEPAVVVQKTQQLTHFHPPTLRLARASVNVRNRRESLDCRLTVELSGAYAAV